MKIKIPKVMRACAPKWTKKIQKRETWEELGETCKIDGTTLSIGMYNCCIVGEALGLQRKFGVFDNFEKRRLKELGMSAEAVGATQITNEYHLGCDTCRAFSHGFQTVIDWNKDSEEFEVKLQRYAEHLKTYHNKLVKRKMKKYDSR